LALACAAWLAALARGEVQWQRAALYAPVLAYALASLAAVLFSADPGHSVFEVGELATLAVVPMVVCVADRRWWDRFLVAVTAVAAASSLVGLWQYLHGASSLSARLSGLTNHYMTFSGWTLVVTLLLVGDIALHPDRRRLLWSVPACLLFVTTLLLSFTRNAWIGLAAGLLLVAAVWRPRALLLYPVAAVVLALVLPGSVLARAASIVDLEQPSNRDRLCMVASALEMVQDSPVFGVGVGMVERRYPSYRLADAECSKVPHLHSNPFQICAERGLLGLASYVALLAVFLVHTSLALRRAPPARAAALVGCLLAVAGISVAGLFEYYWGDAEVWILTLAVLAAPFAVTQEQEHS
jgi:O-antigen ligase